DGGADHPDDGHHGLHPREQPGAVPDYRTDDDPGPAEHRANANTGDQPLGLFLPPPGGGAFTFLPALRRRAGSSLSLPRLAGEGRVGALHRAGADVRPWAWTMSGCTSASVSA